MRAMPATRRLALSREEREKVILDTAQRLFYARGVHEVGMDELVRETGLGKATVYRLCPSKDHLIGAYLERLKDQILAQIDDEIERHGDDPEGAIRAIFSAVASDVARKDFRGCPFNNASIEFSNPDHPARIAAREYRQALHGRLQLLSERTAPGRPELGDQLALLIDGVYTNAAHLGPAGPATSLASTLDRLLTAHE